MTTTLTLISAKKSRLLSPSGFPTNCSHSFVCMSPHVFFVHCTLPSANICFANLHVVNNFFYCCCGCTWRVDKSRDKLVPTLLRGTQALKYARNCFFLQLIFDEAFACCISESVGEVGIKEKGGTSAQVEPCSRSLAKICEV